MRNAEIKAEKKVTLEELEALIKREKNIRIYQRLLAIRLSYLGESVPKIAQIISVEESTVYEWIKLWNEKGYEGLIPKFSGGAPSKLSCSDLNTLYKIITEKRPCDVMDVKEQAWDINTVRLFIKKQFSCEYTYSAVWKIVRNKFGLKYIKPYPNDYRRPDDADQILIKRIENIKDKIQSGEYSVGFLDETCCQNKPSVRRILTNLRRFVLKTSYNLAQKVSIFTFMDILGNVSKKIYSKSTYLEFIDFLRFLKSTYKKVIIILDNAKIHLSSEARKLCGEEIIFVYLPPYSPDLNPVEQLFRCLKRRLKNKVFKNVSDIVSYVEEFFSNIGDTYSFYRGWMEKFLNFLLKC
jgi:putative transposase